MSGFPQRRAKQGQVHFDEVVPDTSCHAGLFSNVLLEKIRTCFSLSYDCEEIVSGAAQRR